MATRTGVLGRTLAVTLTAGVALTLAGCGNQHTGPGYANSGVGLTYPDKALTKEEITSLPYAAALKAKSVHTVMTWTGEDVSFSATGDAAYGARRPAMKMTMSIPKLMRGKIAMRVVGNTLYMQVPGLTPPSKFFAIDPTDAKSPLAKSFAGYTDQVDPLRSLKSMDSGVQSVDRVGKQKMGGVTVEHYRLSIDTTNLQKAMGPAATKEHAMPDTLPYDLWLDELHQIRRMSFELPGFTWEASMSRWGKPVNVQRPSPSQIVTMPRA